MIREAGFRKADDFYVALGQGKLSAKTVSNKVMQRLKQGEAVTGDETETRLAGVLEGRDERERRTTDATNYGIDVEGVDGVMVRLAKCCRPVPGDEIVGYVSLGRGITIHRDDCKNVNALKKSPERFTPVSWDGDNRTSYRVEIAIDAYDRTRLLEDLSRTFSEAGVNILEARCKTKHPMVQNRFVVEVGDTAQLKAAISRLRQVEPGLRRLPRDARRLTGRSLAARDLPQGESRFGLRRGVGRSGNYCPWQICDQMRRFHANRTPHREPDAASTRGTLFVSRSVPIRAPKCVAARRRERACQRRLIASAASARCSSALVGVARPEEAAQAVLACSAGRRGRAGGGRSG